ncbi:alpha/beta fold hydrolase [Flavobacteriaceae sp. LMIT009]
MPILDSSYKPPFIFRNGFVATVYSGLWRKVKGVIQTRERITLNDGDFLDLDWSYAQESSDKLLILLHGLEGDAQRPYMLGAAKLFSESDIDVVGVNLRGCSGEQNLKYRSYNSGATEDLHDVINYILKKKVYNDIYLKGFSLGGNIVLKYLGERQDHSAKIKAAVAISVPCLLYGSCVELHKLKNRPYAINFLFYLKRRLREKQISYPNMISKQAIDEVKTLKHFDDVYTAPAHGYKDALEYYEKCSSLQFLENIKVPTLLINAKNDSFLSKECYPLQVANKNPNLFLEIPKHGGHVAFITSGNVYYNERRALEFVSS